MDRRAMTMGISKMHVASLPSLSGPCDEERETLLRASRGCMTVESHGALGRLAGANGAARHDPSMRFSLTFSGKMRELGAATVSNKEAGRFRVLTDSLLHA